MATGGDYGRGIAVDDSGNAYVTGQASDPSFPLLHEYQAAQGSSDAFITKLAYGGSGNATLVYSTRFGGDSADIAYGIAIDDSGGVYITGITKSFDFPLLHEYQS